MHKLANRGSFVASCLLHALPLQLLALLPVVTPLVHFPYPSLVLILVTTLLLNFQFKV